MQEQQMTEQESLKLITEMINKTKQSFHETGFGPIMWGAVVTICGLVSYCAMEFDFKLPFDIWSLVLLAIIPQVIYSIRENKIRSAKSYNDIAMDFTWIAFGISMGVIGIVVSKMTGDYSNIPNIREVRGDFRISSHITGFYLIIYAVPTFITGGVMKFRPMLIGGIVCWFLAALSTFTNYKIDMLLTAIAACVAWLIPGLILYSKYRKLKQAQHV